MVELFPVQQQAVDKLVGAVNETGVGLNASETGTGKTIMALATAKQLGLTPYVVAPLASHATWHRWAKELNITKFGGVLNVEKLRTGKQTDWVTRQEGDKKELPKFTWHLDPADSLVIADEVHRGLQGYNTQTARMMAMLKVQKISTILMSATPFVSPLNMHATGYLLGLHNWNKAAFYRWCRAHACFDSPFHRGLEFNPQSKPSKTALERINHNLKDVLVKLTTEDLAEFFPDSMIETVLLTLSPSATKKLQKAQAEVEDKLAEEDDANALVIALRFRQLAELQKLEDIADMVEDSVAEGLNVFVALGFVQSVNLLADILHARNLKADKITGNVPTNLRVEAVNAFQNDSINVIVATVGAGGESISLHNDREGQRPRTSLISPTYSASELIQALGRVFRAGGRTDVVQRIVLAEGTIEERVARKINSKISNIKTLTDTDLAGFTESEKA